MNRAEGRRQEGKFQGKRQKKKGKMISFLRTHLKGERAFLTFQSLLVPEPGIKLWMLEQLCMFHFNHKEKYDILKEEGEKKQYVDTLHMYFVDVKTGKSLCYSKDYIRCIGTKLYKISIIKMYIRNRERERESNMVSDYSNSNSLLFWDMIGVFQVKTMYG